MKRKIFLNSMFFLFLSVAYAQPDFTYWNKVSYFKMGGGTLEPGREMLSTGTDGLFAKKGFQIGFDYNYMIAYGFGLGVNLEINQFQFNREAFEAYAMPLEMDVKGGYSSAKFGLNALFNLPIVLHPKYFTLNLYIEGNAGLRGMSIPSIDMYYDERDNKYVEVSYRSRGGSMGYLGYSGGVQFLISNKFGINVSYNAVEPSRHSINYSVRMFDAEGQLYEDENYLNNALDHTGLQFGVLFMFGK